MSDAPSLGYAVYKPGKGENPLWDFPLQICTGERWRRTGSRRRWAGT